MRHCTTAACLRLCALLRGTTPTTSRARFCARSSRPVPSLHPLTLLAAHATPHPAPAGWHPPNQNRANKGQSREKLKRQQKSAAKKQTVVMGGLQPQGRRVKKQRIVDRRARNLAAAKVTGALPKGMTAGDAAAMVVEK